MACRIPNHFPTCVTSVHLACEGYQQCVCNEFVSFNGDFRRVDVQIILLDKLRGVNWLQHMLELLRSLSRETCSLIVWCNISSRSWVFLSMACEINSFFDWLARQLGFRW